MLEIGSSHRREVAERVGECHVRGVQVGAQPGSLGPAGPRKHACLPGPFSECESALRRCSMSPSHFAQQAGRNRAGNGRSSRSLPPTHVVFAVQRRRCCLSRQRSAAAVRVRACGACAVRARRLCLPRTPRRCCAHVGEARASRLRAAFYARSRPPYTGTTMRAVAAACVHAFAASSDHVSRHVAYAPQRMMQAGNVCLCTHMSSCSNP